MKVILATRNVSKLLQILKIFEDTEIKVLSLNDVSIEGEAIEDGKTLKENAFKKADFVRQRLSEPEWVFADDTGFYIEALSGKPGIKAARWLGENVPEEDTMNYCLRCLEEHENRRAYFMTAVALISPEGNVTYFEGKVFGNILKKPRCKPQPQMPYSCLFVPNGQTKTWAEMDTEEVNKISHRGIAFRKVIEFFQQK